MHNDFATATGQTEICGVSLRTIWDVDTDRFYDVPGVASRMNSQVLHPTGGTGFIAMRTVSGTGTLEISHHGTWEVFSGTLVITDWEHLRRYRCTGDRWQFWWFEFNVSAPPMIPMHETMEIPVGEQETLHFEETRRLLRGARIGERRLASATFVWMLYEWLSHHESKQPASNNQQAIWDVIEMMHEKLGDGWMVSEMARASHMSERAFRRAFHAATGQSPKNFYDTLRLNNAMEQLRLGLYSVSEVAYLLGFSSPFHFSRAFREHFGVPPSKVREI